MSENTNITTNTTPNTNSNINSVYIDGNNEVKVMFNNINVYNDIVLMNMNKEFNVDELINKIVDKYSK